jgi:hypothetical protein
MARRLRLLQSVSEDEYGLGRLNSMGA